MEKEGLEYSLWKAFRAKPQGPEESAYAGLWEAMAHDWQNSTVVNIVGAGVKFRL